MKKDYFLDLDRPRELRFGFKAARIIRQKFGNRTADQIFMNLHMDEVPTIVYAGLLWQDDKLTLNRVEILLDESVPKKYTMMDITDIALGALADHMGVPQKEKPQEEKGKKASADNLKKTEKTKLDVKKRIKAEEKKPIETIPSTKKQKK